MVNNSLNLVPHSIFFFIWSCSTLDLVPHSISFLVSSCSSFHLFPHSIFLLIPSFFNSILLFPLSCPYFHLAHPAPNSILLHISCCSSFHGKYCVCMAQYNNTSKNLGEGQTIGSAGSLSCRPSYSGQVSFPCLAGLHLRLDRGFQKRSFLSWDSRGLRISRGKVKQVRRNKSDFVGEENVNLELLQFFMIEI